MSRADDWSADWCCEKLIKHSRILDANTKTSNSVQLTVEDRAMPVIVATMSAHRVEVASVPEEFHKEDTEFLLNIPNDAYLSGALLEAAAEACIGVGGLGDLYVAANECEFREYIPKEARFILRGLRQHTSVREVSRINNRTYQVQKNNGRTVRVLALNEYDLTREALRSGIDKYGVPDLVLTSNPNCRLSSTTKEAARDSGTDVLAWRQLLGALNN